MEPTTDATSRPDAADPARPLVVRASGSCVACDYPLDRLPLDDDGVGRCPECGRAFRAGGDLLVTGWPTEIGVELGGAVVIASCLAVAGVVAIVATSPLVALAIVGVGGVAFTVARIVWRRSRRRGGSIEWVVDDEGVTERSLGRVVGFRAWADVRSVEARGRRGPATGPWIELTGSVRRRRSADASHRSRGRLPDALHGLRTTSMDDALATAERIDAVRLRASAKSKPDD